jgi:hypothetical protein
MFRELSALKRSDLDENILLPCPTLIAPVDGHTDLWIALPDMPKKIVTPRVSTGALNKSDLGRRTPIYWMVTGKEPGYFLRGFLARRFGAAPRALLTTLLPVPLVPTGACSMAAWM